MRWSQMPSCHRCHPSGWIGTWIKDEVWKTSALFQQLAKKKDSTYHVVLCDVVCRKRGERLDDYSILCKNSGVFVEKRWTLWIDLNIWAYQKVNDLWSIRRALSSYYIDRGYLSVASASREPSSFLLCAHYLMQFSTYALTICSWDWVKSSCVRCRSLHPGTAFLLPIHLLCGCSPLF